MRLPDFWQALNISGIFGGLIENKGGGELPKTLFGVRTSALFETLIFLTVVVVLDIVVGSGQRFIDVSPHPFWIIVLLITVQYGTREALVAAGMASIFLLVKNLPEHQIATTYEYFFEVVYRPFLWIATAVILGELRTRQIKELGELKGDLNHAEKETETITRAYNQLKILKENLETRLAGELRSAITIYGVAKSLESLDKEQILTAVEDAITSTMNPRKFSIYFLEAEGFNLATSHGWEDQDFFQRNFYSHSVLYQALLERKNLVSVIFEEDEHILAGEGILAGPLIDTNSGEIFGMLKIEELGFRELSMNSIETFKVLCEWIGMAYANAKKYNVAKEDSIINYEHMLFTYNYFKRQREFLTMLAERTGFDLTMLVVRLANVDDLTDAQCNQCARVLGQAVNSSLRRVDQVFNDRRTESEFAILLPGTPAVHADTVIDRINRKLEVLDASLAEQVQFSFSVQALFAKGKSQRKQRSRRSGKTEVAESKAA